MAHFLLVALVAVVLGIIGVVAQGLGCLLIIGIVFLGAGLACIACDGPGALIDAPSDDTGS